MRWQAKGSQEAIGGVLRSISETTEGSLISRDVAPGASPNYEVRSRLKFGTGSADTGGQFVKYLRATPNAQLGTVSSGTFYAVEWSFSCNTANTCEGSVQA